MYENFNNDQQFNEPPKAPKKTHSAGRVLALIAAVAIVGGGAGFGGAFAASKLTHAIVSDTNVKVDGSIDPAPDDAEESGALNTDEDSRVPDAESRPTLDDMQSGAVIHNRNDKVEFNSDGSYAYTRDLVAAVRDSIVYIEVFVDYRGEPELYGAGSGIIISEDGYIVTNAHVIEGMDSYVVHVSTTDPTDPTSAAVEEYEAMLLGSDTDTDLAVLKIDAKGLQVAVLGDSDELQLGDDVVAIGNPMGLETSVTKGIISGLNRQISDSQRSLSSIQTDAPINSGNSGGALFNYYGEVIGVVNSKYVYDYAESIGFAITINEAKDVIDDLVAKGYVSGRPILGITCLQVSEYVASVQDMVPGLLVTEIEKDLPIAESELVVGDTITEINGTAITTVAEVSEIIKDMKPGDTVEVTVVRTDSLGRDKEVKFDIILAEYNGS